MILMIAAGILLAFILLPILGPIVMVLLSIGVIAFLFYAAVIAYSSGSALIKSAQDAMKSIDANQKASRKYIIQHSEDYQEGLQIIQTLLSLQKLQEKPAGFWYAYILNERFRNCSLSGIFRVDDKLNREHLEKYLQKAVKKGPSEHTAQAEELSRKILGLYDKLCSGFPQKTKQQKPENRVKK